MTRPLLICDCDEVLLHMMKHFRTWLDEVHAVDFAFTGADLVGGMRHRATDQVPDRETLWGWFGDFFPHEMHRQTLVPHAREALAELAERCDVVVLTNLSDACRTARIEQLAAFGIEHRVECNSGGKGEPVARLVAEHGNPVTVFVDDLGVHHESVAKHAPGVHRLHMVSEPELAPVIPPAAAAHVRIDDWQEAARWIAACFDAGVPAADLTADAPAC